MRQVEAIPIARPRLVDSLGSGPLSLPKSALIGLNRPLSRVREAVPGQAQTGPIPGWLDKLEITGSSQ
jgi:hypothetical protein